MDPTTSDPASALPKARRQLKPSDVLQIMESYRKADPARDNRAALLKCYWRHPHESPDADSCLLEEPSVTNYGLLTMAVDRQRKTYLDTFRQRSTLCRVVVDDGLTIGNEDGGDVHLANRNRRLWGEHIGYAFEKYCVRRWARLDTMINTTLLNMLLFSKGVLWWRDPVGMECRCIYAGDLLVPPESSHIPEEWDSFIVCTHLALWELWEKMEVPGWNREAIEWLLKNISPDDHAEWSKERDLEMSVDGTGLGTAESKRTIRLAYYYQREKDGSVTLRVLPENKIPLPGGGSKLPDAFLMERQKFANSMAECISLIIDNPGLGKFHKTPSFAENLFVASVNYDNCMNKAADAVQINSMLLLSGGDEAQFRRQSRANLHDRLWFPPGMTPAQVRFTLPVAESMEFARAVYQQTLNATGASQIGATNDAGAKTPKSATQSWFDGKTQESIATADIVTFSLSLTPFLVEAYKRFVGLTKSDDQRLGEGLELFKRYLRSKKIPDAAWDPKNVEITCRLGTQAATPASRLQNYLTTMDILARTPASKGEQLAMKEAITSIHGAESAEDYIDDAEVAVVDAQDRLIGFENEAMRDAGANPENFPVLHSDMHLRHLFGREREGTAIGHLADIFATSNQIKQMLSIAPDPADEGMWLDKIAQGISNMNVALQHSAVHVIRMRGDKSKEGRVKKAEAFVEQLEKIMQAFQKVFEKLQAKRQERLMQERQAAAEQQGGIDPAKQAEIELKRQSAEAQLGSKLLTEQMKREEMAKTKALEREEKAKDAELNRQIEMQNAAVKAATASAAPPKPSEPRRPKKSSQ